MKRVLLFVLMLAVTASLVFAAGKKEAATVSDGVPTLSYYLGPPAVIATHVDTWADAPIWQEYQKRVGINVEFIRIPQDAAAHLSLLIAAGDYPDMIEHRWGNYTGGPAQAIADGVILPLNDVFRDHAPNMTNRIEMMRQVGPDNVLAMQTGAGEYFGFPMLRVDDETLVFVGPQLRADWLAQTGMALPETIADWERVLTAFRDEYDVAPLSGTGKFFDARNVFGASAFASAYRVVLEWHNVDGHVQHGFAQPELIDFLTLANSWYQKGLIDPEFVTNDRPVFDNKVYNGQVGAFMGFTGSSMGLYLNAMADRDPDFDLVGAKYPVLNRGDYPYFGQRSGFVVPRASAISTKASDVATAARFLDYAYGEEGHMLFNFGIEGVSYTMVNGFPTYTDTITNNPDGLSVAAAMGMYTGISAGGSAVQDGRYAVQYLLNLQQQADAVERWAQTNAAEVMLVDLSPAPDVADEYGAIWSEVQTHAEESLLRFITGSRPLSQFNAYLRELEAMGYQRARAHMQAAYDALYN